MSKHFIGPPTSARSEFVSRWAAPTLVSLFVVLQALTLDYGTRINGLPFIRDYRISSDVTKNSALEREAIAGPDVGRPETLDRAMLRFKLYSIEADEMLNVMALARMRPAKFQFDPHFYTYGGAFLYPLGVYYAALSKLGLLSIGSFEQMLANPQTINGIWIAGRVFVLLAVAAAGVLLYLALSEFAPPLVALAGLAIFLFCPGSVMFSLVMKPHWYALLFANAALLIIARALVRRQLTQAGEIALSIVIGLAVGTLITFALFAILTWTALIFLSRRGDIRATALISIPAIAIVVFLLANPYYVLNWQAVAAERLGPAGLIEPALSVDALLSFARNSALPGFGVALVLAFSAILIRHLLRPAPMALRLLGVEILFVMVITAAIMAKLDTWHSIFRYISFVLPLTIVFLAAQPLRYRQVMFTVMATATIIQAVPLKLAYFDENSDDHSARLAAAAWIDAHVPPADGICVSTSTMAPFNVPPFRFDRHKINPSDCKWAVQVEGIDETPLPNDVWTMARRFRARLSPSGFPLVWENINPKITIYHRLGT